MPERDDFNLTFATSKDAVDGINADFYGKIQYPWPPRSIDRVVDPDFWVRMLGQDLGSYGEPALAPGARVWVAGCGTNQALLTAIKYPRLEVIGSDLSKESLAVCAHNAKGVGVENLELRSESINDAPYEGEFDHVVCTGVIHHNADAGHALGALARALKPDGLLELMVYNKYHRVLTTAFQLAVRTLLGDPERPDLEREIPIAKKLVHGFRRDNLMSEFLRGEAALDAGKPEGIDAEFADRLLQPVEWSYTVASLEAGMKADDSQIAPSMLYAYAAIMEGVPYANGAPNLSGDIPALEALAKEKKVPIGGKDFKTGQTLMKTILAPGFKTRMLGLSGWFSTNILGNRDGEVLDDPASFKTKEESKLGALEHILQPEMYPQLYGNMYHKVRINYYPPRGDNKEGWDNIDIFGWMGYPMQIKVDFLCRDSILAAPIVLDLALFLDLASRAGMSGIQEWLSFYFKAPQTAPGLYPEHDIFIQHWKLKNTLRWMKGEDALTHLGVEYYD